MSERAKACYCNAGYIPFSLPFSHQENEWQHHTIEFKGRLIFPLPLTDRYTGITERTNACIQSKGINAP